MAGDRWGAFTCVRWHWQVTLCDPIWQVTSRSSEMGFPCRATYIGLYPFFTFLPCCWTKYEQGNGTGLDTTSRRKLTSRNDDSNTNYTTTQWTPVTPKGYRERRRPRNTWKRDQEEEMWTAGYKYSWRTMEAAAQSYDFPRF